MARTTPAQKPRGEHSKTFSAGRVAAPVMRTSFDASLRHSTWAAPRLLSSEAAAIPIRGGFRLLLRSRAVNCASLHGCQLAPSHAS
jgi:hypothetical protein